MGIYRSEFSEDEFGLGLENTVWANTVIASQGYILGQVLHTGKESRMEMNQSSPRQKRGKLDQEVNWLTKVLFSIMAFLALVVVAADSFGGAWYLTWFRMLLLLSSIIPISMRINLDLAKIYYSILI